ncbi:MAG: DUF1269 domain-containing protein [Kovacikia sp.]
MSDFKMMAVYAAAYDSLDAAEQDYEAVKVLYYGLGLMDTFDAAVVTKNDRGKVKIVKKHEQPTRQGGWLGAGLGLATGLLVALFPGVALGTGMLAAATGGGAVLGALAGHAVGGMSRADLKDLGDTLDPGQAGLVVIAETDVGDRVAGALSRAKKVIQKQIKADRKELEKEIEEAAKE